MPSHYASHPNKLIYSANYGDGRRRLLPSIVVTHEVERFSNGIKAEMTALALRLKKNKISLQEWYDEQARLMKLSYYTAANVARGQEPNHLMTAAEIAFLLWLLSSQFDYLNEFAEEIAAGKVDLESGRFTQRAGMYGASVFSVFQNWRLWGAQNVGYTEARRLLSPAEHCSECLELAAAGWMPISKMIPLGQTTCLGNCKCIMQYRNQVKIFAPPEIPVVRQLHSDFVEVRNRQGKLMFKYDPNNQRVEIKHKFMNSAEVVDLKRYQND